MVVGSQVVHYGRGHYGSGYYLGSVLWHNHWYIEHVLTNTGHCERLMNTVPKEEIINQEHVPLRCRREVTDLVLQSDECRG